MYRNIHSYFCKFPVIKGNICSLWVQFQSVLQLNLQSSVNSSNPLLSRKKRVRIPYWNGFCCWSLSPHLALEHGRYFLHCVHPNKSYWSWIGWCISCGFPLGSPVSSYLSKHSDKWIGFSKLPLGVNGALWLTGVPSGVYSHTTLLTQCNLTRSSWTSGYWRWVNGCDWIVCGNSIYTFKGKAEAVEAEADQRPSYIDDSRSNPAAHRVSSGNFCPTP